MWLGRRSWNHIYDPGRELAFWCTFARCRDSQASHVILPSSSLFQLDYFGWHRFIEYQDLVQSSDIHSCFLDSSHRFCSTANASLRFSMRWKFLFLKIPTLACRYKVRLDPPLTEPRSSCPPPPSLSSSQFSFFGTREYRGIQLDTSMFEEKSYNAQEILFKSVLNAYREYSFCKYCTCQDSDSLSNYLTKN